MKYLALFIPFVLLLSLSSSAQKQVYNVKDLPDGWHRVTLEGGMFYNGQVLLGQLNGKGIMSWPDSSNYSGIWKSNMRHGKGTMTWKNGNVYMGHFKMDEMSGTGTYVFSDGRKYYGRFKDDVFHGKGTMVLVNGSKEKGKWENGEKIE